MSPILNLQVTAPVLIGSNAKMYILPLSFRKDPPYKISSKFSNFQKLRTCFLFESGLPQFQFIKYHLQVS